MSHRIVVVGDALLDVRAVPAGAVKRASDVPGRIDLSPGGQGANVAVRLARQGLEVELVTALADDGAGSLLDAALRAEGLALRALPTEATGTVVVLAEDGGERTMLSQRPAFAHLVEPAALPAGSWVVVSGYVLHEPAALELCTRLAAVTDRRALLGCAVPEERVGAWRAAAEALRPDLLVLNRDEAARLVPPKVPNVAVTDAAGATVSIGGVTVTSITSAAAPARDTTGAGDAFAAGLLAGLLEAPWPPPGDVMQDAVEAAVALGSRVARAHGAQARVAGERAATVPTS